MEEKRYRGGQRSGGEEAPNKRERGNLPRSLLWGGRPAGKDAACFDAAEHVDDLLSTRAFQRDSWAGVLLCFSAEYEFPKKVFLWLEVIVNPEYHPINVL